MYNVILFLRNFFPLLYLSTLIIRFDFPNHTPYGKTTKLIFSRLDHLQARTENRRSLGEKKRGYMLTDNQ
jgi:hypothetical protein